VWELQQKTMKRYYTQQSHSQKKLGLRQYPWLNSLPRYLADLLLFPSKRKKETTTTETGKKDLSALVCLMPWPCKKKVFT